MMLKEKIRFNFSSLTREGGERLIFLAIISLLSRYLNVEEFGRFIFAFSLVSLFSLLIEPGWGLLQKEKIPFSSLWRTKITMAFLAFVFLIFISMGLKFPPDLRYSIYFLCGALIINSFKDFFLPEEGTSREVNLLQRGLEFLVILWFLRRGQGIGEISSVFLLGSLLGLVISWKVLFLLGKGKKSFGGKTLGERIYKDSLLNFYLYLAPVILYFLKGEEEVGMYGRVFFLVWFTWFLPFSLSKEDILTLGGSYRSSRKKFQREYVVHVEKLFIPSLILAIAIAFFPAFLLRFLYGEISPSHEVILIILIWSLPLFSLLLALRTYFLSSRRRKEYLSILGTGILSQALLNFYLISSYGARGGAVSFLVGEFLMIALLMFLFYRRKEGIMLREVLERPIVAGCGMATVLHYLSRLPGFLSLLAGILIFVLLLHLQNILTPES